MLISPLMGPILAGVFGTVVVDTKLRYSNHSKTIFIVSFHLSQKLNGLFITFYLHRRAFIGYFAIMRVKENLEIDFDCSYYVECHKICR